MYTKICSVLYALLMFTSIQLSMAQNSQSCINCCEITAPTGLMYSHSMAKKEFMVSYLGVFEQDKGLYNGNIQLTNDYVFRQSYMAKPLSSINQMHMIMLMYGITDKISIMAMTGIHKMKSDFAVSPYNPAPLYPDGGRVEHNGVDHSVISGGNLIHNHTALEGLKLSLLFNVKQTCKSSINLILGVSAPSFNSDMNMNYYKTGEMSNWCSIIGISAISKYNKFLIGNQTMYYKRLGLNNDGFKTGDDLETNFWGAYSINKTIQINNRIQFRYKGEIQVTAPKWDINSDTYKDPQNYGGMVSYNWLGLTLKGEKLNLPKLSLSVEYGIPIYQNLNGWQLKQKNSFIAGINYRI